MSLSRGSIRCLSILALLLGGCGGGGSGGGDAPPVTQPACALVDSFGVQVPCLDFGGDGGGPGDGSAGDGKAIAFARVTLTDAANKSVTATTDAQGYYRANLAGFALPIVAKVDFVKNGVNTSYYSFTTQAPVVGHFRTINLTGFTDFVASEVAKAGGKAGASDITPAIIAANPGAASGAIATLNALLTDLLKANGFPSGSADPITTAFRPNGSGYDAVLDAAPVVKPPAGTSGPTTFAAPKAPANLLPGTTNPPGTSLVGGTVTLSWSAAATATSYRLKVNEVSTGSSVINATLTATSYPSGLNDAIARQYSWTVEACNSSGCSGPSSTVYFNTTPAPGVLAVPASLAPGSASNPGPMLSSFSAATPVSFSWSPVSGATRYEYGYAEVADNLPAATQTTQSSFAASLLGGKTYKWFVRACNAASCSADAVAYFQTPTRLPTPTGMTPGAASSPGQALLNITVSLAWNAVAGATYYAIEIYDETVGTLVYASNRTTAEPFGRVMDGGKVYRWTIAACNTTGCSDVTPRYFETPGAPIPAIPAGLSPGTTSAPAEVASLSTVLSWTPVAGATSYSISITNQLGNPQTSTSRSSSVANYTTNSAGVDLVAAAAYKWSVRACNASGCSLPSVELQFLTPAAGAIPATPVNLVPGIVYGSGTPPVLSALATRLSWSAVTGATFYSVSTRDGYTFENVKPATAYQDLSLVADRTYRWSVKACNAAGCSASSVEMTFKAPPAVSRATLAIAPSNATRPEGHSGETQFTFLVTRAIDTSGTSSATWTVSGNGTNPANAADFVGGVYPTGTVSFVPGQVTAVVTVRVAGDTSVEPSEGFAVTLSNPVGATLDTSVGQFLEQSVSGGSGVTENFYTLTAGSGGAFTLVYDMYGIPDRADVYVNGSMVVSTNGAVSGGGTLTIPSATVLKGGDVIRVVMTGLDAGTSWTYTVTYLGGVQSLNYVAAGTIVNDD